MRRWLGMLAGCAWRVVGCGWPPAARSRNPAVRISPISLPSPTSLTAPTTTSPAASISRKPCAAEWPPSISTTTAAWTSSSPTAPSCPNCEKTDPRFYNCLLHNRGDGTFEDVTARAGLLGKDLGFSFGVAAGDYDNDGYEDLFVCNAGRNTLYHNNGDGTFTDVTERSGIDQAEGCSERRRRLVRLRQRRQARSDRLQLHRLDAADRQDLRRKRPGILLPSQGLYPASRTASITTSATAASKMSPTLPVSARSSARGWASPSRISTATAIWTYSWPTTPCAISCSSTRRTGRSRSPAYEWGVAYDESGNARFLHGRRRQGLR